MLWLDAGDAWHGTPLADHFDGVAAVEALNAGGLDAAVLGEYDFSYGQSNLARLVEKANFHVLSANTVRAEGGSSLVSGAVTLPAAGLRVAVLGLTSLESTYVLPGNIAGLRFLDPVEVASTAAPALWEEADLVVVLSHLGLEADKDLAARVPGIDVIVGGHSH